MPAHLGVLAAVVAGLALLHGLREAE